MTVIFPQSHFSRSQQLPSSFCYTASQNAELQSNVECSNTMIYLVQISLIMQHVIIVSSYVLPVFGINFLIIQIHCGIKCGSLQGYLWGSHWWAISGTVWWFGCNCLYCWSSRWCFKKTFLCHFLLRSPLWISVVKMHVTCKDEYWDP